MRNRRFLLLHITTSSGHHRASCAIQRSLSASDPSVVCHSVDAFHYASPIVRYAIHYLYYSLIQHQPDVWEYLYDNPSVHSRVQHLRALLHRYHAAKFRKLVESFKPDAIVCTQAYPCGMVADFKRQNGLSIPLIGVLTDHAPHLYWFHQAVDIYVVPTEEVRERFIQRGVAPEKLRVMGIPIDPGFTAPTDPEATARQLGLDLKYPTLLIMGGGGGFGRLAEIVLSLDHLPFPCQMVVVAGTNHQLLRWVKRQRFRQKVVGLGFVKEIPALMDVATLIISKPGGLTTAEALAKRLPMVIVNPIPGQEAYNARFLLSQGAAVQAGSPSVVRQTVRDLLEDPRRIASMRQRSAEIARPDAADAVAAMLRRISSNGPEWTSALPVVEQASTVKAV